MSILNTYLIKGDLSGIQSFIFNVKSKGAAQSLKGRSFFLKILLEVGMRMIFDECEVPEGKREEAKISTSGGNFVLMLELEGTDLLVKVQRDLTKILQYTGLNMVLAHSIYDKDNYKKSLENLNEHRRKKKYQLLMGNHDLFESFPRSKSTEVNDNERWKEVTKYLRNSRNFEISPHSPNEPNCLKIIGKTIEFGNYIVEFGNKGIDLKNYLESLFPGNSSFELLAKIGGEYGLQKLGILAMDVDNLGNAIEDVNIAEEHMAFDKRLKEFFNNRLRDIINAKFKDQVYVVTSGGDDSYFVGKWNTMLDLALKIKEEFKTAFPEPILSISGALVIVDMKFPVVRFAAMADDAIKKAKYNYDSKGNFSLFDEVLDWDILADNISRLRADFRNERNKQLITSGLLANARQTAFRIAKGDGLKLSDFWKMSYYMRNFGKGGDRFLKTHRASLRLATNLDDTPENQVKINSYKLVFPIAARLAEFDKRKN